MVIIVVLLALKDMNAYYTPKIKYNIPQSDQRLLEKDLNITFSEDFVCQSVYHQGRDSLGLTVKINSTDWEKIITENLNFIDKNDIEINVELLSNKDNYNWEFTTCYDEKVLTNRIGYSYFYNIDDQYYVQIMPSYVAHSEVFF